MLLCLLGIPRILVRHITIVGGYGWVKEGTITPLDIKSNSRDRNRSGIDQRLDTLIHMQGNNIPNFSGVREPAAWQCQLNNGKYSVTVSVGDQPSYDSQHTIRVQGVVAIDRFGASATREYKQSTVYVDVTNGLLTVDAIGGTNTKINYIEILPVKTINFQPDNAAVPAGYTKDIGEAYSDSRGYGWVKEGTITPLDIKSNSRDRNRSGIDQRLDTLIHMQGNNSPNFNGVREPAAWQCQLNNGKYSVTVSVGDRPPYDSQHTIRVQGVVAIDRFGASATQEYNLATVQVDVTNGLLTVDAIGGTNTKINYIEIESVPSGNLPSISSVLFESDATGILVGTAINLTVSLVNGQGVDGTTLNTTSVQLYRTNTNTRCLEPLILQEVVMPLSSSLVYRWRHPQITRLGLHRVSKTMLVPPSCPSARHSRQGANFLLPPNLNSARRKYTQLLATRSVLHFPA